MGNCCCCCCKRRKDTSDEDVEVGQSEDNEDNCWRRFCRD
jgi:hypothetical protein